MTKKDICLGCSCMPECLDADAKAVLWINDYYKNKAKELHLYTEDVEQYVMPKFWQTKEEFCNAKEYCLSVYKTVMAELAGQLDIMHNTCFGKKGWRVIIGDWIQIYIEAFYDKYIRMKYVSRNYLNLYLKKDEIWYISKENELLISEILQAQQYRDIYEILYPNNIVNNMSGKRYEVIRQAISGSRQDNERQKKYIMILKKVICRRKATLYLSSQYLALSRTVLELLSGGRIQRIELPEKIVSQNSVLIDMRRMLKRNIDYKDEFINLIYDCLWRHIPMKFIEDFQDYYEISQKLGLKIPTKIVDSIMIYHSMLFKIFVAEAINHSCKLEIIQHGGDYCIEKYTGSWDFEIADKFYTWGNGFIKNNNMNMYAMPCPKTLSVKRKKPRKILFVEYANYPYVTRIEELHAMKMEEFYGQEEVFFQALGQNSRELLQVRCHHFDQWWNRKEVLAQKFPWMQFDITPSYYASMTEARLVVTNVIGTTCMEAISCDIPTLLFFSEEFFVPDENAVEILNELRRVEVLLDSPEKAAELINENADHIEKWWNEKERKKVINKFSAMYASHGPLSKLKWIRELVKESKTK